MGDKKRMGIVSIRPVSYTHLLLEKPMAMNVEECEKIEEAVKANGVKIQIDVYKRQV